MKQKKQKNKKQQQNTHILESAQYGLESVFKILGAVSIVSNVSKISDVK